MGSERRPHNPVTRSSSAIGKLTLIGVVHYPFVEKNRSSHFGFVSTSLRPLRTSVPQPVSKLTCRRCRSRQRTKKKPPNGIRQTDKPIWELTVVTTWWSCGSNNWSPGGASWLKKSVAVVPYSGGAPDRVPDLAVSPVSISSRALLFLFFCLIIPSNPRQRPRGYGHMTMSSLIPPVGVGAAPSQSRHKKLKCDRQVNSDRGCSLSFR